ncbi:S8 family serine peptidase [Leptolyngbya sp. AN02str]|uniref:S8 family serine peptidase n=1 Tax=Leptolyngbya sp. AN02str TaxID=3423363 RepID=UPI003D320EC4
MTAFDPNQPSNPTPSQGGVLPEQEGLILQRGGEELRLTKVRDRLTVRLVPEASVEALANHVGALSAMAIATVNLVELRVEPSQLESAMQAARSATSVVFASHVYAMENSPETLVYLTNELTVQFGSSVEMETIRAIATSLGIRGIKPVAGIAQTFVFELTQFATANPIKLANQLMRMPEVLVAEPNVVIQAQPLYRPTDSEYGRQWYLSNTGGVQIVQSAHISAEAAWDVTRGVRSIVVAITDDGVDLNHPDFQGKGKIVAPRDLKRNDVLPMPEEAHENHGTACAGVAVAEENTVGIVGVAPGCSLMPIRTTGYLDDQAIEDLFNWAIDKGAAVISCSWGPSAVYFSLSLRQRAVMTRAATQGRNGKGCVIVFSAGNANRPVSGTVNERGWQGDVLKGNTNWLNGYAVHPDVITVSASTSLGKKAAYSNWGDAISVCAPSNNAPPGVWLPQTGYVFTAPQIQGSLAGQGVVTSDRLGSTGYGPGDYTNTFGGTSSSCPVVAGIAGLILSVNPFLTARDVKQILQNTADKIVDTDADPQLGNRFGTYNANGHSRWFGYGKVNAAKAVQAARDRLPVAAAPTRWVTLQNITPTTIPDFNLGGATSLIQVLETAPLRDLRLTLDVEHQYLGDLEITLLPLSADPVLLQSRTLGRATRLQTTYTLKTTPMLRQLLNQSPRGTWQLRLIDYSPSHTGRLLSWQLSLGL